MTTEATVRAMHADGTTWLSCLDVAVLLLDAAATADAHPDLTAGAALRGIAAGLGQYEPPTPKENR
jgi:hypothetical protein